MMNFNEVFNQRSMIKLDEIKYKQLPHANEGIVTFQINDDIFVSIESDGVLIKLKRCVKFEPKSIFDLSIVLKEKISISEEVKKDADFTKEKIKAFLVEENNTIIGSMLQWASLLISQITSVDDGAPMVTPPSFLIETK